MNELPRFRIVTGAPVETQQLLNELAGDYSPIVWHIASEAGAPVVTCVLISTVELRRQAQLQAPMFAMPRAH